MEQLSPQHVRSSLSGGQADSERTQFNTRVRKHQSISDNVSFCTSVTALGHP